MSVSYECCVLSEVTAIIRSLVQRTPTYCGASLCVGRGVTGKNVSALQ